MKQGAALLLPVRAQREDTVTKGDFAEWMIKHIDRWFSFAKRLHPRIERMEDIILVTGRHRTRSWTNLAFIENQGLVGRDTMQVSLNVQVSGGPLSHVNVDWKVPHKLSQGVASNMGPSGEVRRRLACAVGRALRLHLHGLVRIRIYPRINAYLSEDSVSPTPAKYCPGSKTQQGQLQVQTRNVTTPSQKGSLFQHLLVLR